MTCKDCLKKELGYCKLDCTEPWKCLDFKNKSEWVHLPCKINDTFYYTSFVNKKDEEQARKEAEEKCFGEFSYKKSQEDSTYVQRSS